MNIREIKTLTDFQKLTEHCPVCGRELVRYNLTLKCSSPEFYSNVLGKRVTHYSTSFDADETVLVGGSMEIFYSPNYLIKNFHNLKMSYVFVDGFSRGKLLDGLVDFKDMNEERIQNMLILQ